MNILLTIAARGGSKGVRNKNIRHLKGKPLIAYTIEQALKWGKASRVVVSTDSVRIAEIAKEYGAEVPFMRPRELATDSAPKVPVLRHALRKSENLFQESFEIVVDLDPTAPVRNTEDLDACLATFLHSQPKTLFSVVVAHKNPYFNMVEERPDGFVQLCKQQLSGGVHTRQSAPAVYEMNASIYFYQRDFLLHGESDSVITDRSAVYVMDEKSSYDIDREIDLVFLEFLLERGEVTFD
jgi:CMP-N-acetylneuraminic acid synthetase